MTQVNQRLSLHYSGNFGVLRYFITQVAGLLETIEGDKKMKAFGAIEITFENKVVILEVSDIKNIIYIFLIILPCIGYDNVFVYLFCVSTN